MLKGMKNWLAKGLFPCLKSLTIDLSTLFRTGVPPMVQSAKSLALDITSPAKVAEWRKYNGAVSAKENDIFCSPGDLI